MGVMSYLVKEERKCPRVHVLHLASDHREDWLQCWRLGWVIRFHAGSLVLAGSLGLCIQRLHYREGIT